LDIKPGKIWTEESTFKGNQKGGVVPGTVDKNESIYGFVIDRQGNFGVLMVSLDIWYFIFDYYIFKDYWRMYYFFNLKQMQAFLLVE
jgi:hypothetical protein